MLIDIVPADEAGPAGGTSSTGGANLDHLCLRIEPFDQAAITKHLAKHHVACEAETLRAVGYRPCSTYDKNGAVVGEGVNNVINNCDPTSHGEVEAIRDAARRLGRWDLSGCDLYTTCEPCELCVAAMFWAKISRLYYANSLADYENIGFDLKPLTALVRTQSP
jgi:tRNA(Arg) A34 adenosine deaminase TadA